MQLIKAIIEKANDGGYAVYAPYIAGGWGSGLTEDEAKEDFLQVIEEVAEYYKEKNGEFPQWYQNGYEIEYCYDVSAFFLSFPFINASKFAKAIGINPSLMRKYKERIAFAGEKQKALIQQKYNEIINKMSTVQF
jgi:predicted RNase H-like HicB family nuclease